MISEHYILLWFFYISNEFVTLFLDEEIKYTISRRGNFNFFKL